MSLYEPYTARCISQGCVSVGEAVVSMEKLTYVELNGFIVDCARETAIMAEDGMHTRVFKTKTIHNN